jgi:hypothetical protein
MKTKFGTKIVGDIYRKHLYFLPTKLQKALEKFKFKTNHNIFLKFLGYEKTATYESPAFEVASAPSSQKQFVIKIIIIKLF